VNDWRRSIIFKSRLQALCACVLDGQGGNYSQDIVFKATNVAKNGIN
jgi:hypothetical protein